VIVKKRPPHLGSVRLILVFLLIAINLACEKRADRVAEMDVYFEWNSKGTSVYQNPEIHLSAIPETTDRFTVKLVDLDMKSFHHGGGEFTYTGSLVIPTGELEGDYQGPQAPPNKPHRYEISVKALDTSGKVVGEGRYTRQYPEGN
jgi:phosphatidylethanolamine-binding protein (PEBP) family uncharacterized protein